MKLKVRKPIFAFLIMLLLLSVFTAALFTVNLLYMYQRDDFRNELRLKGINETIDMVMEGVKTETEFFDGKIATLMDVTTTILRKFATGKGYEGPDFFGDGFVVSVKNGKVIYPSQVEAIPDLTAEIIESEPTRAYFYAQDDDGGWVESYISVKKICDHYYYIDVTSYDEFVETIVATGRFEETFTEIEQSYNCKLIILNKHKEMAADGSGEITSLSFSVVPDELDIDAKPEDVGITQELIDSRPAALDFDDTIYKSFFKEIKSSDGTDRVIIILTGMEKESMNLISGVFLVSLLILFFMIPFIMGLYWYQTYVRDHELTTNQSKEYHPKQLRKHASSAVVLGVIGIFIFMLFYEYASNVMLVSSQNRASLNIIKQRFDSSEQNSVRQQHEVTWAVYIAERIAQILSTMDDPFSYLQIDELNELVHGEYMMLFNTEGLETVSSNGLIGYSLIESEELKVFKPLLSGITSIEAPAAFDTISGKKVQLFGVRVPVNDGSAYGALIIALDPEERWENLDKEGFSEYLNKTTPEGYLCILLDKTENTVSYSSDPELVDQIIPSILYKPGDPEDSDLDSYMIDKYHYYGPYDSDEDMVYYYLTDIDYLHGNALAIAGLSALGLLIIASLTAVFMLKPYSVDNYKTAVRVKSGSTYGEIIDMDSLDDFFDSSEDTSPKRLIDRWQDLIPEEKSTLFTQVFLGLIIVLLMVIYSKANSVFGSTVLNFILFGNWKRGFNLLSLFGIGLIILGFIIFVFFKDILLRFLCAMLDSRGDTVCTLIFGLVQYGAVIGCIYLILGYLGFNPTVQLTSVGIISLAISLGSKDLVSDILAGIFIIFEDDFHVGDFIEVNGVKGIVQEIGVRSTKILCLGDNIKIIDNQSIKNVVNMSKMNTWYTMEIRVPMDTPILEIEAMMETELPEIAARIPEILSGPYYKGIWSVGGGLTLAISCECEEEKCRQVRRKLNREILLLFNKYGYKLL